MPKWEYKISFVDFRGRISTEGQETLIGNERRTSFVRRYLDELGGAGWELVGIQPLDQHSAYYVFKRTREAAKGETPRPAQATTSTPASEDPAALV